MNSHTAPSHASSSANVCPPPPSPSRRNSSCGTIPWIRSRQWPRYQRRRRWCPTPIPCCYRIWNPWAMDRRNLWSSNRSRLRQCRPSRSRPTFPRQRRLFPRHVSQPDRTGSSVFATRWPSVWRSDGGRVRNLEAISRLSAAPALRGGMSAHTRNGGATARRLSLRHPRSSNRCPRPPPRNGPGVSAPRSKPSRFRERHSPVRHPKSQRRPLMTPSSRSRLQPPRPSNSPMC